MEPKNKVGPTSAQNASLSTLSPAQDKADTVKAGKHRLRQVLYKAEPLLTLLMPRRFERWLEHTKKTLALADHRIEVLNTLPSASKLAFQLDYELAFDRTDGLHLDELTYDPVKAETSRIAELKKDPGAKPFSFLGKLQQKLGGKSFNKQNQRDIARYLTKIIQNATTVHALTHLHQQTQQMVREGHITNRQFHQLSTHMHKQFKEILPLRCEPLLKADYAALNRDEARDILERCYDIAIALKTAAPSLLRHQLPNASSSLQKTLHQAAISAYKRTVIEIKEGNDEEIQWFLNDSQALMQDKLRPVLLVTSEKPWLSRKAVQSHVKHQLHKISDYAKTTHHRLQSQLQQKDKAFAHHQQLQEEQKALNARIEQLQVKLTNLRKVRSSLREKYAELKDSLKKEKHKQSIISIKQALKEIKRTGVQVSQDIRQTQQQIRTTSAKVINSVVDLSLSEQEVSRYQHPVQHQFASLYEAGVLTNNDLAEINICFGYVAHELNWSPEDLDTLFESYIDWVSMESVTPGEALHYLYQAINTYSSQEQGEDIQGLDEVLFDTRDAILGFIQQKHHPIARLQALSQDGTLSITEEDVTELTRRFRHISEELGWSPKNINLLLDHYTDWVSMKDITPREALHYLDEAIGIYTTVKKNNSSKKRASPPPQLHKVLKSITKDITEYVAQKNNPVYSQLQTLYASGQLSDDDFAAVYQMFVDVSQENWPEASIDALFSHYIKWIDMENIAPHEALYYLKQVIEIYMQQVQTNRSITLDDILPAINDAIVEYASQKGVESNSGAATDKKQE